MADNEVVVMSAERVRALIDEAVTKANARSAPAVVKEVLSLTEAAEFLGRHPRQVTRLVREEGLPAHYISEREPRFKRTELLAWIDSRPNAPAAKENS